MQFRDGFIDLFVHGKWTPFFISIQHLLLPFVDVQNCPTKAKQAELVLTGTWELIQRHRKGRLRDDTIQPLISCLCALRKVARFDKRK